ncbi:MAG TPA: hypothetical protein VGL04_11675 [Sporichthyaceae bacterium]|jgi:hypothetical protein
MSLMSAIRRLMGVRGAAVGEATLAASAPEAWMAFGGPPPHQPAESDRAETTSQFDDRRHPDATTGKIELTVQPKKTSASE